MSDFFNAFDKSSKEEWAAKLHADLKGKSPELLQISDEIEELDLSTFYHTEDAKNIGELPGNAPFSRGMNRENNNWNNGTLIQVDNEQKSNKDALAALNSGADMLVFKAMRAGINWSVVIDNIQFEYIEAQFVIKNTADLESLSKLLPNGRNISYNIDFLEDQWSADDFANIATRFKNKQQAFCSVSGFKVQQAGATTWQELAFALTTGHSYLHRLMKLGFSIDEASACISFKLGIGSNYFYEIAKMRVFRKLWGKIIDAYNPEHNCSHNSHITAVTGHLNKSLMDPYTNLLRQTTEAMAAVSAGVDAIVITPYDMHSSQGPSELAERMALNISSILKEESYLDKVLDPTGGSYSIENIAEAIGKKAWGTFQAMESDGGIDSKNVRNSLKESIQRKASARIEKFTSGEIVGIGINKYPNIEEVKSEWKAIESYLGMNALILENEFKTQTV